MPLNAQTARFDATKNISVLDSTAGTNMRDVRKCRANMPIKAGSSSAA